MNNQKTSSNLSFVREQSEQFSILKKEFTKEQLAFVKGLVNTDLTDTELYLFLALANKAKLNPFTKEIIAVVYGKDNPKYRKVNFIVTRDGKRNKAFETGEVDSVTSEAIYVKEVEAPLLELKLEEEEAGVKSTGKIIKRTERVQAWEGGTLWGATATVTRKGKKYTVTVPLDEYDQKMNVWATKKSTMIKKVAESQAWSLSFPDVLGGLYDEAELPAIEAEVVNKDSGLPATPDQIATIKSLGGEVADGLTQEAAKEEMKQLMRKRKTTKEEGK